MMLTMCMPSGHEDDAGTAWKLHFMIQIYITTHINVNYKYKPSYDWKPKLICMTAVVELMKSISSKYKLRINSFHKTHFLTFDTDDNCYF